MGERGIGRGSRKEMYHGSGRRQIFDTVTRAEGETVDDDIAKTAGRRFLCQYISKSASSPKLPQQNTDISRPQHSNEFMSGPNLTVIKALYVTV